MNQKPLTRDQLAQFLPSQQAIKAFEALFKVAVETTPGELEAVSIESSSAMVTATAALDALNRVAGALDLVATAPMPCGNDDIRLLTQDQRKDLTDGGETTLHFHPKETSYMPGGW